MCTFVKVIFIVTAINGLFFITSFLNEKVGLNLTHSHIAITISEFSTIVLFLSSGADFSYFSY